MVKKVLMLHGYAQNANIFSKRMRALRNACGKDVEFVFIDAPHVLVPVDFADAFRAKPGTSSLSDSGAQGTSTDSDSDPALAPRYWWNLKADPAARSKTIGVEDSILLLRDVLSKDHYDGILGFSQGAAMAALVAALLEKPNLYPPFLIDGKPPHPPVTFCVAAAGFRPMSPLFDSILLPTYSTPTLHILGRTDVIVVEERSKQLLEVSTNKRVEWHHGGHFIPPRANRNIIKACLEDPLGEILSPHRSLRQERRHP
ncbi:hypothetical protein OH76DRAFT_1479564 [Lentinus brumalis]|uniref:Serine hydrolase domain-containing protein n=1 Tax=Lentinus brumalis TaxID=2498619 RepID=A0A371DMM3_9APHY|nr:hypothetical protein OH76DRAFT_1479564 [Polyporus brumalis]